MYTRLYTRPYTITSEIFCIYIHIEIKAQLRLVSMNKKKETNINCLSTTCYMTMHRSVEVICRRDGGVGFTGAMEVKGQDTKTCFPFPKRKR